MRNNKGKLKFYLILFLCYWLVFTLITYKPEKGVSFVESLKVGSVGGILITLVYVFVITNLPKQVDKIFKRKTYQTFIKDGFVRRDDSLVGKYKNYNSILNILWNFKKRPLIEVTFLFDPESYGHYFTKDEFESIVERNSEKNWYGLQNKWTINSVSGYVLFGFREPSYKKIEKKMNELVSTLIIEKLAPITHEELQKKIPSITNHYSKAEE